ncbi:hypothetical protein phytr_10760 [Candidatus Phycorickettsia trachydisci]|uniref:Uncharacterized protein n=1 Tax=Candidatus Phycorickettsia trachydisci TaxID=2115978 RepID=A0A2P1P9Q3_9RICK|nr:hypothetical protein [Candidatus Phycorickettsia trachydisci]AVP88003.1 hypothetical protein phytr_10760 [Candidatus Phycorickettsia trachydisci]
MPSTISNYVNNCIMGAIDPVITQVGNQLNQSVNQSVDHAAAQITNVVLTEVGNQLNGSIDHAVDRMEGLVQKIFLFCVAFKLVSWLMDVDLKGRVSDIKNFIYPEKALSTEVDELTCEDSLTTGEIEPNGVHIKYVAGADSAINSIEIA